MQGKCMENEVSNVNDLLHSLQGQSNFQEVQPISVFEYSELSRVNMGIQLCEQEHSVDISVARQCIGTTNDCLIVKNNQDNDLLSEIFDSRSEGLILSEIPLFESEFEVPQSHHLDENFCRNSEKTPESVELTKEDLKIDPINLYFNLYDFL
ncbi:hypothetical protein TNIN_180361 [Trichonephila inaurata madagascariensis]|uniref:Uncharacterized protein n=1 Tax=Trichonephila inaurata madagascariensis TaxID=2747483 RepID=A0A8X7CD99_9ARAC|nr:hypothetical protein TNIN_180361 [Trichonephila inaurata madagascariensis]